MKKQLPLSTLIVAITCSFIACKAPQNVAVKSATLPIGTQRAANIAKADTTNGIAELAAKWLLTDSNLTNANIGISIYDATAKRFLYNYQGNKYFIPASNIKLFTCFAAMHWLGDSLAGLSVDEYPNSLVIHPTADPTLLHPDFSEHPVVRFLQSQTKKIQYLNNNWNDTPLGLGWSWDDETTDYAAERSALPIYGNVITATDGKTIEPAFFSSHVVKSASSSALRRSHHSNSFEWNSNNSTTTKVPFITSDTVAIAILKNYTNQQIDLLKTTPQLGAANRSYRIYSQKTDSVLAKMMHRSDNFYAEQLLMMLGNETIGTMDNSKTIANLLTSTFSNIPQKPKWIDGCGLSRYNLATPQNFVWVLTKMQQQFAWKRIATILPTGGQGTLRNYYTNYEGKIYAKTGSMGGVNALSGYLITNQQNTLIFSIIINNYTTHGAFIRKAVEKFTTAIIEAN